MLESIVAHNQLSGKNFYERYVGRCNLRFDENGLKKPLLIVKEFLFKMQVPDLKSD